MASHYRIEYVGGDWDKAAKVDVSFYQDGHRQGGLVLDPAEESDAEVSEGSVSVAEVSGLLMRLVEHPDWKWN